jgi:integrase/recombinase XerD
MLRRINTKEHNMKAILGIAGPDLLYVKVLEGNNNEFSEILSFVKWNKEKKYWVVPFTDIAYETIQKYFGKNLELDSSFYLGVLNREIKIRKYSMSTRKIYIHANIEFLKFIKKKPVEIVNEDVQNYLFYYVSKNNPSSSTINSVINGLKFMYGVILKRRFIYSIARPKRDKRIPNVLSKNEIKELINRTRNIKHKTILLAIYSAGLRVSEVVQIKINDIDFSRKCLIIRSGKGRKDRQALFSEKLIDLMKQYFDSYRPYKWAFEGQDKNRHLTIRSAQQIFKQALLRAKIDKNVGIHSLRHSFATHLLENGIDIRYIQELMGHKNIATTEIYTHVSKKAIFHIKSPFDTI